jgi:hypothetical protein
MSARPTGYNRGMKYRKQQIAWSAAWGIAILILVGLTVRSYWIIDGIGRVRFKAPNAIATAILLDQGVLSYDHLTFSADPNSFDGPTNQWFRREAQPQQKLEGFAWQRSEGDLWIHFPTWLLGLFFFVAALIPLPRFSLRTLLIDITLVAVALGVVVWGII